MTRNASINNCSTQGIFTSKSSDIHIYYGTLPHQQTEKTKSEFGRTLLAKGLKNYGIDDLSLLRVDPRGKPYLAGSNKIHFNLSYSDTVVLCGISNKTILGIDVEKLIPKDLLHFQSYFTSHEREHIKAHADPMMQFYKLWTRKEAVIKADGRGLDIELNSFSCLEDFVEVDNQRWFVKNFNLGQNYISCIAMESEKPIQMIEVNLTN